MIDAAELLPIAMAPARMVLDLGVLDGLSFERRAALQLWERVGERGAGRLRYQT